MTINSKKEDKTNNKNESGLTIPERIEHLEMQISDLTTSSVYQTLEKKHISLVTSPIKKTNVILKNVNFQYAVKLWNYMQSHMEDNSKKEKKKKKKEKMNANWGARTPDHAVKSRALYRLS